MEPHPPYNSEQYLVIYDELIATFLYALAAVAALSLLVLGKPGVVFFICMAVVRTHRVVDQLSQSMHVEVYGVYR